MAPKKLKRPPPQSRREHLTAESPYPPGPTEARSFYYGLPSCPRLVARSSAYVWAEPTGIEAYRTAKDLFPLDYAHRLRKIWESKVGPALVAYLDAQQVQWTSLDPVRIGYWDEPFHHPTIVWIGVKPDSINNEQGVPIAVNCKKILDAHGVDDVHVEIRHSEVFPSAGPKLSAPTSTSEPTGIPREPFCTIVGLSVSSEQTPSIDGTGGLFVSDPRHPEKLYLVAARHVLFPPDSNVNELYRYKDASQPRRNVLLFGDAAVENYTKAIKFEIDPKEYLINHIEPPGGGRDVDTEKERDKDPLSMKGHVNAFEALKVSFTDLHRQDHENRILGHITLSPPIGFGIGEEGFTEDWAAVEVGASKIDATNFVGNVIDLGTTIRFMDLWEWMSPFPNNQLPIDYFYEPCLPIHGIIPDEEVWRPSSKACHRNSDPYIMVLKRGHGSDLTVGSLNTIRSFTRFHGWGQLGQFSKEVAVFPRSRGWKGSLPFSGLGDSGAAVVDGRGRLAGLLTGGAGDAEDFDCTYLTSANFILKRMSEHGLEAKLPPAPTRTV